MLATELLMEQHAQVAALIERAREESDDGARIRLLGRIAEELTLHAALEENFVYPLLKQVGLSDEADRSVQEHEVVRELIGRILELEKHDPEISDTLDQLDDAVRDHVQAEEYGLFPVILTRLDRPELEKLTAQMQQAIPQLRKLELLKIAEHRESPRL